MSASESDKLDENTYEIIVNNPPEPVKNDTYIVTKTTLNIRTGPSREHEVIGMFNFGDKIDIIGEQINGWQPVDFNGTAAFVNALSVVKPFTIDKNEKNKPEQIILDIPYIRQRPNLPSGCEATSLAMALNYYGVFITKEMIAKGHIYDDTEMARSDDGSIYIWGNPSKGYVGDPFSIGYTIFPNMLKKQADQYMPSIDTTGATLETLEYFIAEGKPVLVWITNEYEMPNERFWATNNGRYVYAPNPLHNVVLTGYDEQYVYVNDPEDYGEKNYKILKEKFEYLYNLMGMKSLVIGNGKIG